MTSSPESLAPTPGPARPAAATAILGDLQQHLGAQPQRAEAWYALGVALSNERRFAEAAAALQSASTLSPTNPAIEAAWAWALVGVGESARAGEILEEVVSREPGQGWAIDMLAAVRFRQGRLAEAESLWAAAVQFLESPTGVLENLAVVRRRLGDSEGERRCWRRIADLDPGNPMAEHMLGAMGEAPARPRAADAYVEQLFDRFAGDFDDVLARLEYAVPDLCERWLRRSEGEPRAGLRILDVGCGTGLAGERLRPWAQTLIGVDLSSGMLERAASRGAYSALHRSELLDFLKRYPSASHPHFDVVVAADVLCYFGDVAPFVKAAMEVLGPGGWLAFSVEAAPANTGGDYVLRPHGRYAHSIKALASLLPEGTTFEPITVRLELGRPVEGYWVAARKRG